MRTAAALAVLCPIAAVLRWPDPRHQLEYDEVIAILFARHDFGDIVRGTAADTMPPLYYWLLHLWAPAGDDLAWTRLLSTVLGVAAVPAVYLLGRRFFDRVDALAGAALFALSPFPVFYGHYARMYALLALLGLLAVLFFVRWLQEDRRRDLVLFTAAAGLSLYVHNLAVLLIMALDLLFLVQGRRRFVPLAIAHAVLFVAYVPWLTYLPGQLEKVTRAFWIPPPGPAELVRTPLIFLFHLPLPDLLVAPAAFVALLALAVTVIETRRHWRPELVPLAVVAAVPIALMFLISQVRPVYVERAVLVSAAAYYLLLATALRRMPIRPLAWGIAGAVGLVMAAAHGYQYAYEGFPRSPHYAIADQVSPELRPGDLVLHDNKLSYFPTYFFSPDLPQTYLPDPPGSANDTLAQGTIDVLGLPPSSLEEAVRGRPRVWFVIYKRALDEAAAAGRQHEHKAWLDQRYRGELKHQIGDLQVWLYHIGSL